MSMAVTWGPLAARTPAAWAEKKGAAEAAPLEPAFDKGEVPDFNNCRPAA